MIEVFWDLCSVDHHIVTDVSEECNASHFGTKHS